MNGIFTKNNLIFLLMAAIIVIVLLWKCSGDNTEKLPSVPAKDYIERTVVDSIALQKFRDSVEGVIVVKDKIILNNKVEIRATQALVEDLIDELNKKTGNTNYIIPDSLKQQIARLRIVNSQKDSLCNETIAELEDENKIFREVISKQDTFARDLNQRFKEVATDYIKKSDALQEATRKRVKLYAGITVIGNKQQWVDGFGINVGLKLKNGFMIEPGVLQIGSVTNYTLGLKTIISLRKK